MVQLVVSKMQLKCKMWKVQVSKLWKAEMSAERGSQGARALAHFGPDALRVKWARRDLRNRARCRTEAPFAAPCFTTPPQQILAMRNDAPKS